MVGTVKFFLLDPSKEIRKALDKATSRSTNKRHQTGCVIIDKKGEIISDGCAHASSFRINDLQTIHSEIHAIARGRHTDLQNCVAYVQTIARKSGNKTLALPCLSCAVSLKSVGIETAIYTVDNETFAGLDLEADISHLKVYPKRMR